MLRGRCELEYLGMKEFYVTLLFWAVIRMFNVFPLLMCVFNMYNINSVSSGLVLSFAFTFCLRYIIFNPSNV